MTLWQTEMHTGMRSIEASNSTANCPCRCVNLLADPTAYALFKFVVTDRATRVRVVCVLCQRRLWLSNVCTAMSSLVAGGLWLQIIIGACVRRSGSWKASPGTMPLVNRALPAQCRDGRRGADSYACSHWKDSRAATSRTVQWGTPLPVLERVDLSTSAWTPRFAAPAASRSSKYAARPGLLAIPDSSQR